MNKLTEIEKDYEYEMKLGHFMFPIKHVEYLLSLIEEKDKALEFYADEENYRGFCTAGGYWKAPANDDDGYIARTALTSTKEE